MYTFIGKFVNKYLKLYIFKFLTSEMHKFIVAHLLINLSINKNKFIKLFVHSVN